MAAVYINGKFLTQKMTGVQRYAFELVQALYPIAPDIPLLSAGDKLKDQQKGLKNKISLIGNNGDFFWEQITLPFFLGKRNNPLLVNLCNTAPVFYKNKISCIHDLSYLTNPSWFSKKFYRYYRAIIPLIIRRSRHIITVSEFSKNELMRYFKLRSEGVTVVPNACSRELLRQSKVDLPAPFACPYFLFVGSLDPRKNLFTLLEAYKQSGIIDTKMVIVGTANKSFQPGIEEKLHAYKKHPGIHFAGHVDDRTLAAYYQHARAVVIPSLYEGFGLPLVEALANGCRVIASDIPVFREVAEDFATYFNPDSVEELCFRLREFDGQHAQNKKVIDLITRKYNWESSAVRLMEVIRHHL